MAVSDGDPVDRQISPKLFVRHGNEARDIAFYEAVLDAWLLRSHTLPTGQLCGADLAISRAVQAGATLRNPVTDADMGYRAGVFIDSFGYM